MKAKGTLLTIAAAAVLVSSSAMAQVNNGNATARRGGPPSGADADAMRAERERIVAIYDENGDGMLDEVERDVLFDDIESGEIEAPRALQAVDRSSRRGGRDRKGPPAELVAQYDADGDGELNATERAALRADVDAGVIEKPARAGRRGGPPSEIVDQFDADGDGELNADERAALQAAVEAGEISPPAGRSGRKGSGAPHGPPQEIVDQFDANGDGTLDADERAAVRAAIEAGEIEAPAPRQGGRGR